MKQGDYVLTKSGLLGKIVWDGKVPSKGYMFGIELVEWSETGNDGSYNGKHYFRTSPGHGLFSYERNLTLTKAPPKKQKASDSGVSVGDKVSLRNGKEGTVMWVGCFGNSTQEVIGIKLRNWTDSGNDGKKYFDVPMGYGYFAKLSAIASCTKKSGKSVDLSKVKAKAEKPKPKKQKSKPKVEEKKAVPVLERNSSGIMFKVGDKVRLKRGREGVVKFIGTVGEKKLCGLELDAWSEKGNNGKIKEVQYFTCKPGRGYFTSFDNVAEVLVSAKIQEKPQKLKERSPSIEEKCCNEDLVQIALGDKVRLRKGRVGHVRFIGNVKGVKNEIVGLELLQWFDRGNNGTYGDVQYFTCKEGTGYWTSRNAIDEVLARSENKPVANKKPKSPKAIVKTKSTELDEPIIKFGVGDVVRLKKGREGTVKYYNKKTQIVGMELKNWNADCGDGTYKGKEFFKCDQGRGYFTSAKAVNEVLKRVAKIDVPESPKREKSKSLSIEDDCKNAPVKFQMGDKVRLKRGKIGTVKYIGKTNFAKGVVVGLELNSWNEKGNDGSVNGKRFFTTRGAGWGYFTKPDAIAEVLVKKA